MISLLLPAMATADEQRIGFVAGSTYGVGLGYSKQFKDGRGWQVSALPIVEDDLDATVFPGRCSRRLTPQHGVELIGH
jgi:hypothetical protein